MVQADEDRASFLMHRLIEETWRALGHWDTTLLDELAGVCRGLPTRSEWSLDKEIEEPVNRRGLERDLVLLDRVLKGTRANLDIIERLLEPVDHIPLGYGLDVRQMWH